MGFSLLVLRCVNVYCSCFFDVMEWCMSLSLYVCISILESTLSKIHVTHKLNQRNLLHPTTIHFLQWQPRYSSEPWLWPRLFFFSNNQDIHQNHNSTTIHFIQWQPRYSPEPWPKQRFHFFIENQDIYQNHNFNNDWFSPVAVKIFNRTLIATFKLPKRWLECPLTN